jgi:hypothetical protein
MPEREWRAAVREDFALRRTADLLADRFEGADLAAVGSALRDGDMNAVADLLQIDRQNLEWLIADLRLHA